jgi:NADH:ubiquinone oxidoreductase subunit D
VFLSFSNTDGSAHRRVYDAATGRKLGETFVREGGYRQAFPEDLTETVRLNGNWGEAELDEWAGELPSYVLDLLQRDLDLARAEAAARQHKEPVSA